MLDAYCGLQGDDTCIVLGGYQHSEEHIASILNPKDAGIRYFRNVGNNLTDYTASHSRKQPSS
jgi:hypothetical protein